MRTDRRRVAATLLVALLAVLAGCSAGSGGGDGGVGGFQSSDNAATAVSAESAGSGDGGGARAAEAGQVSDVTDVESLDSRARIRTGRVQLEVTDFERTERNLTSLAESRGGFVSDTQRRQRRVGDQTYLVGEVVIRVPSDEFDGTFQRVQAEGEVVESSTSSEDVTEQLVDIDARLDNLRTQRDRLRTLYEEANDTEDVLQVERRLTEVQTEIERLEARKQSLERRVAYSTITVQLSEERPDRLGVDQKWYDIGFVGAFLESVNGVVVTGQAALVLLGYVLPYLLALAIPFGALGSVVAWRLRWGPFAQEGEVPSDRPSVDEGAGVSEEDSGDVSDEEP